MKSLSILLLGTLLTGCVTTPADVRRQSIEKKLDAIVFPEIEFRQADKYCALAFLSHESKALDPERKGVDIVYIPAASGCITNTPADPLGDAGNNEGRPFTFEVHRVSLREVLNIVCELGDFTWTIEDSVIKVRVKQNKVQGSVRGGGELAPQP